MTHLSPPGFPRRVLARALKGDPAAPAILGDLHEDFVARARARGPAAARRWYAREALILSAQRWAWRAGARVTQPINEPSRRQDDMDGTGTLRAILEDAAYALRTLRRAPAFALFTAVVIGLGVGSATSVFSVLKPLVMAPLPFKDPGRLVWIANEAPAEMQASLSDVTSRSGNLRDFRARAKSFDGITGYNAFFEQGAYTLTGVGEPERLVGADVAADFLDVLGVRPLLGRSFTREEGQWGGPRAMILTHGFWVRRFASDPGVVGRTLTVNNEAWNVVGVLPATFDFASVFTPGKRIDFLLPFPVSDETDRWGNTMSFIGRLRPGVGPDAAQAELSALVSTLQEEQPRRWGLGAAVSPLRDHVAGPFRPALLLLAAAAGTLLLIVCVNVSNLILARAPGRAREIAVRKALGASRRRLVRQLVLETLLISASGGVLGAVLAWASTTFIARGSAIGIPLLDGVSVDGSALLFAVAVAVTTGLVVGLVPALQVAEGGEADALRAGSRGASAARGARRMRELLVMAEVTLACVLLVTGSLLVRSFQAVSHTDLGFRPENTVAWQVNATPSFETLAQQSAYYSALTDRVADVPGVEAVGLSDAVPLRHNRTWGFRTDGMADDDPGVGFFPNVCGPGYLAAMGIDVVSGRDLSRDDTRDTEGVVLINESGAREAFGGEDPVGRTIRMWNGVTWRVVGVVADVHQIGPEVPPGVQVYFTYAQQQDFSTPDMVVRTHRPTADIAAAVSAAMHEVDPSLPTREFWTMDSLVGGALSARRFTLGILSAFGGVALLLAGLGIYGVLAHTVAERTPEIGIRMALGASASAVVRDVLVRTLMLVGLGVLAGGALSLASTRLVQSLLFGVGRGDPVSYLAGGAALLVVAVVAAVLPASRAARTTGIRALRAE